MLWEPPSIFFGGISAESIVWVTLDEGVSWRLLKLIRIGEWTDTEADNEGGGEFAYNAAQPLG
jgi:hypothetical protein